MNIEHKISASARKTFLLYGYHGTTIQKIASDARVSKTLIHYYFRSKEGLYDQVNAEISGLILRNYIPENKDASVILYTINEFRNNKKLFIQSLNKSAELDWQAKIKYFIANALSYVSSEDLLNE